MINCVFICIYIYVFLFVFIYSYITICIFIYLLIYLFIYLYCIYSVCVRMCVTSSSMYCVDLLTDCTLPMVKSIYIHTHITHIQVCRFINYEYLDVKGACFCWPPAQSCFASQRGFV